VTGALPYPRTWTAPPPGRVLILAPHPDDEVIGCGGVAALHRRQGDEVHVVVVTDGDAGDPDGRYPAAGYVELRRDECRRAARELALAPPLFLGFGDRTLAPGARLAGALREVLERSRPEVVYHPATTEMHPDHHATAVAALTAAARLPFTVRTFAYEIWTPVVPTHVIDVSAVWEAKRAALAHYASQLAYNDYQRAMAGLAAYRAIFLPAASHVEAFAETTPPRGLRTRLRHALGRTS